MKQLINNFQHIQTVRPYVHHITNYVTVNDCANVTLAAGGSPAMADSPLEVEEMVQNMHALVLNTGTITSDTFAAMLKAGKKANQAGIPIVLDPVAVGATSFRKEVNTTLLRELKIAVIRGNASEIMTLAGVQSGQGVDVAADLSFDEEMVMAFAREQQTVISTSGPVDFITDGYKKAYCHNGVPMLSDVTGTGCMASSLTGVCVGAGSNPFDGALLAMTMIGIAGEQAYKAVNGERKLGTFRLSLFDSIGTMTGSTIENEGKVSYEK